MRFLPPQRSPKSGQFPRFAFAIPYFVSFINLQDEMKLRQFRQSPDDVASDSFRKVLRRHNRAKRDENDSFGALLHLRFEWLFKRFRRGLVKPEAADVDMVVKDGAREVGELVDADERQGGLLRNVVGMGEVAA